MSSDSLCGVVNAPNLRSILPAIYGPLLPELFDGPAVIESRATCDQCQMCDRGNLPSELSAQYFHPDTKCCTFHPTLPNYLVGAILADPRPEMAEGKRRIEAQIAKRLNVLPQKIAPSRKWSMLYGAAMEAAFGRSMLLRCPYLDEGGRCTIWAHREAVCLTFFCKYDDGSYGSAFWSDLRAYLNIVEALLSSWVAKQVWPDAKDTKRDGPMMTLEELEERPPRAETYAAQWGPWVGREAELYIACYERVKKLGREELAQIVDRTNRGRAAFEQLQGSVHRMRHAPRLPERVALNKQLRVIPVDGGMVLTMPYNAHDSIKIEPELYEVLKTFSHDRTVADTRATLVQDQGIELEDALLTMFATHDILVGPPKGGSCDVVAAPTLLGARCSPLKKPDEK